MLPQQPYSRSGAWHTVPHPGHGGAECAHTNHRVGPACAAERTTVRSAGEAECAHTDHRVGPACMRYLRVDVSLYEIRACAPAATAST